MSDATAFYRDYTSAIKQLISATEQVALMKDRLDSDTGLAAAAAVAAAAAGRTDLTVQVINDAAGAIGQMLFTFNSGSPTQKSYLYKVL